MQAGRSVGAKCDIAIDDAVTHADVLDVFANGFDYPGGLVADDRWKGRDRKSTSTIVNVDEVETYDGVADQCFIIARLTHDDILKPQDFGRTIFVNTGGSRGGWHDISPFKAPVIIVRLLAERRECYLAVGGGWSRPAAAASKALCDLRWLTRPLPVSAVGAGRGRPQGGAGCGSRLRDRGHEPRRDRRAPARR